MASQKRSFRPEPPVEHHLTAARSVVPSFRLTAPIPFESETHEAVAHALEILIMPPAEWTCFPAGHIPLPPQYAAKLQRAGLKRSWPDFLVVFRILHGIEMKRPGEKLSRARMIRSRRKGTLRYVEGQREVFPRLEAAGMKIATCNTVNDVLEQLIAWGIPMRWKP
jgi:hypothetical protein